MQAFIQDRLEGTAALSREHHVKQLALFGSAASGAFDLERNHVDLLVGSETDKQSCLENRVTLQSALCCLFCREVDLVTQRPFRNPTLRRTISQKELYAA